jgi:4-hydroxybenzoate polyprenyltransferase
MRPHQWVKNGFVLAPLVFAQELFDVPRALMALAGFALFCLASSSVYILNDLLDVEADRAHPIKCHRPIASGRVSVAAARAVAIGFAAIAVAGGFVLHVWFGATVTAYLLLNVAYSMRLKHIAYVDVLCITTGFELRVIGGAFAALVPPSAYLLAVTFLLASFLGFGKRLHELLQGEKAKTQRTALGAYDQRTLVALLYATGAATVATYCIYTLDGATRQHFETDFLVVTALMPAFGVYRFIQLVRHEPDKESPTEAMLRDWPFLTNLAAWAIAVVVVLYLGRAF